MKKKVYWCLAALGLAAALTACAPNPAETAEPSDGEAVSGEGADPASGGETLSLRIADGAETGDLVLAGEGTYEVYTCAAGQIPTILLDGKPADAAALRDGMPVDITWNSIDDSWPGRLDAASLSAYSLGTPGNPGGTFYDLCGFWLQVLNDLWERDPGLNGGAAYVSVDLSQAPGTLTAGEQSAVAWAFARNHGTEAQPLIPLTLSYEELREQGWLTADTPEDAERTVYHWEDGVLFRITADPDEAAYSLPALRFDAEKWRGPLGAYLFSHCIAAWPELGTWSTYQIGGEAIA